MGGTWNNLTMRERAGFIKIGVDNGLTSLTDIKNAYNKFAEGGAFGNKQVKKFKDGGEEKKYEVTQGYHIVGDPEYVDNDVIQRDQYGNLLNPYTGGYGPARVPEVEVVGYGNGRAYYTNPDDRRLAELIRDENRRKEAYRQIYGTDEGFYMSPFAISDKPLESVSPEFDLITMGGIGKDIYKGAKALGERVWTGVPKSKTSTFFENFSAPIFATKDKKLAKQYSKGDFGWYDDSPTGKVFRIYPGKTKMYEVTPPPKGYAYYWENLPIYTRKQELKPLQDLTLLKNDYSGQIYAGHTVRRGPVYIPNVTNKAGIAVPKNVLIKGHPITPGTFTDALSAVAATKGYKGVKIPDIVDGSYSIKVGNNILKVHPAADEYIFRSDAPIIKASEYTPFWITALQHGFVDPSIYLKTGTVGGHTLYDHTKALGGHIYDGETENSQQMDTPLANYQYYGNTPSVLEQLAELEFYKQHGYVPDLEKYGYRNVNQNYAVPRYPDFGDINEDLGTNIQNMPVEEAYRLSQQGNTVEAWLPEVSVVGSLSKVKNLDLSDPNNPRMLTPSDQNYILPKYSQTWIDENIPYYLAKQFDRRESPKDKISHLRLSAEELQRLYPNATRADLLREDARTQEALAKMAQVGVDLATLAATEGLAPGLLKGVGSAASKVARGAIDWSYPIDELAMKFGARGFGRDVVTGLPNTVAGANTLAGALTNVGALSYFGAEGLRDLYNSDWGQGALSDIRQNWNNPEWHERGINNALALSPFLGVPAAGAGKVRDWYRYYKMRKGVSDLKNIISGSLLLGPVSLMQKSKWYRRVGGRYDRKSRALQAQRLDLENEIKKITDTFPYHVYSRGLGNAPLKFGEESVLEVLPGVRSVDVPLGSRSSVEVARDLFKEKGLAILDTDVITIHPSGAIQVTRQGSPFNLEQGEGDVVTLQEFGTDKFHAFHLVPRQVTTTSEGFYGRKEADIPKELTQLLEHNSNYIKSLFPKEMQEKIFDFGSAVLTQQKLLGKVPHDIDFLITREAADSLPQLKKASFNSNGFTKTIDIPIDKQGHTASIDFNIIETDARGNITGKLADELITQFFPDVMSERYMNEARKLLGIPTQKVPEVSLDELLQRYDPVKKSIIDSLETNFLQSNKEKHKNRIFKMMNAEGSSNILQEGIRAFGRRMLGEHCMFAPKLDWSDVEANKEFLKKAKLPFNFADNPEKMQSLFELWYLDQTTMYRIIDSSHLKSLISHPTEDDLINAFNVWIAAGGNARGFGLNGTLSGISDHVGDIAIFKQLPIDLSGISSPLKALERMEMGLGRNYAVTAEDLAEMPTVARYLKPGDNLKNLLQVAPSRDIQLGRQLFDELNSRLGTVALHNADITYGAGRYISVRDNTARGSEHFTNQLNSMNRNAVQSLEARLRQQQDVFGGNGYLSGYHSDLDVWAKPDPSGTTLYTKNTKMRTRKELIKMIPKDTRDYSISTIRREMKLYSNDVLSRSEIKRILENPDLIDNMPTSTLQGLFDGIDSALRELHKMSNPELVKKLIRAYDLEWKSLYYGNENTSIQNLGLPLMADVIVLGLLTYAGYNIYKKASGTKE